MIFLRQFCNKIGFCASIGRMITDKQKLVAGCQRKDPEAMKQLYVEMAPMLLGVCMRYTRSRDEAQDLLHDGFIKVYENIGRLENPFALWTWMYKIMVNLSIDYVTRRNTVLYGDMEEVFEQEGIYDEKELDLDGTTNRADELVEALQSLPDRYRVAFNMRAVEEMEYDEIAAQLHLPETTVRSQVSRAKQMILEILKMKG